MYNFLSEKTNFAEYDNPIQELPTFTSQILGHKVKMSYQKDFNISFELGNHVGWSVLTNLTFGKKLIANASLILDLKAIEYRNVYKITPINFTLPETFSFSGDLPISCKLFKLRCTINLLCITYLENGKEIDFCLLQAASSI